MSALSTQIREAVVSRLNDAVEDGDITVEFEATDQLLPDFNEETLSTLRVIVVTSGIEVERLTRKLKQTKVSISVNVMKRVGFSNGEVDQAQWTELEDLVEQIADVLCDELPGFEKCGPTVPNVDPPYDPEFAMTGIFASAIGVTYTSSKTIRVS